MFGKPTLAKIMLVLLVLILGAAPLHGEQLLFGVINYPPYIIIEERYVTGIDVELMDAIAKRLNTEIRFFQAPWKRLLKMMEYGEIDVLSTVSKTTEREKYMQFVVPHYMQGKKVFYILKGSGIKIDHYDDLYRLTVGTERGFEHFAPFDNDLKIRKQFSKSPVKLFQMLAAGRIDALVGTEAVMDYLISKEAFKGQFEKASYTREGTPGYLSISRRSPYARQLPRFNKIMSDLKSAGAIEAMYQDILSGENIKRFELK